MALRPNDTLVAGEARFAIVAAHADLGKSMAEHAKHGSSTDSMDIAQSKRTWKGFLVLIKWSVIAVLLIMGLMAIFRVH